jgi:tetratricopeptide (TPR) repeat protein
LGIANSLNNLGNVAYDQAELDNARALYEESLAIARELEDGESIARLLGNLGNVAMHQRDFASARALHEESLAIKRELGHRQRIAGSLNSLGNLASDQGDLASARTLFHESLAIGRELVDRRGIAESLEGLAAVLAALGSSLSAARIWGATERLRKEVGAPLSPKDRPRYDRRVAAARATLKDDSSFNRAWQEGCALGLEQAIELALEESVERG